MIGGVRRLPNGDQKMVTETCDVSSDMGRQYRQSRGPWMGKTNIVAHSR